MLDLTALRAMNTTRFQESSTAQTNGTLMTSPALVIVIACLKKHGKQTSQELGDRLGLSLNVISARLYRLHNIGELARERITYQDKGGAGYIYSAKGATPNPEHDIASTIAIIEERSNGQG